MKAIVRTFGEGRRPAFATLRLIVISRRGRKLRPVPRSDDARRNDQKVEARAVGLASMAVSSLCRVSRLQPLA